MISKQKDWYKARLDYSFVPKAARKKLRMVSNRQYFLAEVLEPITVYKKVYVRHPDMRRSNRVIKLTLIPGSVVRLGDHWGDGKCRASQAWVEPHSMEKAESQWDASFTYEPSTMVFPRQRFVASDQTCTAGIHFFFTRGGAASYV